MERIISLLVNAAALYVATLIVPNLDFDFSADNAILNFIVIAFIFGLVNTFVKPILKLLTLPITMVTLGLFLLVINALMLLLTDFISDQLGLGLVVGDFWAAILGSIVISIVGFALSMLIGTTRGATRVA
jgi:putative membrane protein